MDSLLPFWTLLKKELLRFGAVFGQTIIAPVFSSVLFLFVFGMSLGQRISIIEDYSYAQFVIPGLVLMGVINNSFANTSSSIFFSRYIGNIVDLLVTPITASQMILAYTIAAMARGLTVGLLVLFISSFFAEIPLVYPVHAVVILVLTSFLLSQLGIIAAIHSDSFEALAMYTNFLLLPLIYFGGMFYPISILPPFWQGVSKFNPLFYTIDGFRHSMLGQGDVPLVLSFGITGTIALTLFLWAAFLLKKGYKIRV